MTPEQWRQVEALYDVTVGHPPEERAALLASADSEVRRLTEALLAEQPTVVNTRDPATPSARQTVTATRLSAGAQIGPYRVEGLLGTGGMAVVYRATDTRLGRLVAIKISDERFSGRFLREAQSIAALNHPHICTLYDIGPNYLVMELVEGETLSARLKRGPLPPPTASRYGAQIADALIAAHSKEITHRDLKPGNVMVTKNGVKVLDFGLAKMKTGSEPLTESHVVVGTPLYMAPEQLEGKACDARTDLYALGLLLYECLTGKPLRQGQVPSWNGIADRLKHVVSHCLEPDPDDRWQTARDLRAELNWAQTTEASVAAPPKRSRAFSLGLTVVLSIAVAGAIYWYTHRSPASAPLAANPTLHFTLDLGPELTTHATTMLAVSPDGTRIVFVADNGSGKQSFATRALNHVSITPMPGTEGGGNPFFSPDGQWIGFSSEGKLKKISIHGGAATTIYEGGDFAGGSWGENNQIIASFLRDPGGLYRVDAAGGTPQLIAKPSDHHAVFLAFPQILPGGDAIIYSATETPRSFDNARIEVMSLKTGKWKTLQQQAFFVRYLPTGHLVWVRNRTLFGAPFDPLRLEIKGPPVALIEDELATSPEFGSGQFDFSLNGLFVYLAGRLDQHRVLWLDAKGNEEPLIVDPSHYRDATLAPDGKHLVLTTGGGNRVIHIFDMERRVLSRLSSFKEGAIRYPVWSSDSRHIAFIANDKGKGAIWWMRADGMGEPHLLYDSESPLNRFYFSADNKTIVIEASTEIWIANLDLNEPDRPRIGKREFLFRHLNSGFSVAFSPDGRWMAYTLAQKDETGLFVRPADWHKPGKWQITTQADKYPAWSRSSREILYQAPDNYIWAVDYAVEAEAFVPGKPRLWLDRKFDIGSRFFDLAADGKHVVAIGPTPRNTNLQATFKVNFFEEVRRRTSALSTRP